MPGRRRRIAWGAGGLALLVASTYVATWTLAASPPPEPGSTRLDPASPTRQALLAEVTTGTGADPLGSSCERWVAPSGNDGASGTQARPWATLEHAAEAVPDRGCTVWFANGVYVGGQTIDRGFDERTIFRAIHPYEAVFVGGGTVLDFGDEANNMTFRGFEIHQSTGGSGVMVYLSGDADRAPHDITFRGNVLHDSYDEDLMKIRSRSHHIVVRGNVFYNQGDNEQHMDVNSVTDITIEGNIFFNDFARSGREDPGTTKHFIVVKDSNEGDDGMLGSERVTIARNVFMSFEGDTESFVALGNDGKPFHEAQHVTLENNLLLGNGSDEITAPLTVFGARNVDFINNTVVGNMPSASYAIEAGIKGSNPANENILLANNIWSDPTGTMDQFSDGDPANTIDLLLDGNLYWNGGDPIPGGSLLDPLDDDAHRLVGNPLLETDQDDVAVPFWNGSSFLSGSRSIKQEFVRLVETYGSILATSRAVGAAAASLAPQKDILGHPRDDRPDLGAFEA